MSHVTTLSLPDPISAGIAWPAPTARRGGALPEPVTVDIAALAQRIARPLLRGDWWQAAREICEYEHHHGRVCQSLLARAFTLDGFQILPRRQRLVRTTTTYRRLAGAGLTSEDALGVQLTFAHALSRFAETSSLRDLRLAMKYRRAYAFGYHEHGSAEMFTLETAPDLEALLDRARAISMHAVAAVH